MFKVKSKQVEAFAEVEAADFPERLLAFLRRELPEACRADDRVNVDRAIVRARGWGLQRELDIATFAVLTFIHGPEFDGQPWAQPTLARDDLSASERIHQVYEAAIRRLLVEGTALAGKEQP